MTDDQKKQKPRRKLRLTTGTQKNPARRAAEKMEKRGAIRCSDGFPGILLMRRP